MSNPDVGQFLELAMQLQSSKVTAVSEVEAQRLAMLHVLRELGKLTVDDNDLKFEGTKIVLPATYKSNVPAAIKYLQNYVESQEKRYEYSRVFKYRPWDGANAFQNTLRKLFGTTGIGADTLTFFGSNPPQMRTVASGVDQTIQVPWGEVNFPQLDAKFSLSATRDEDFGMVFQLFVVAPRKYNREISAFFDAVGQELTENSIYKGKAIDGADNPGFVKLGLDPSKVVYSDEVFTQLQGNLWGLFQYTDEMRRLGIPLKRAVLLEGPYGAGKTLAGKLTAQQAVANGWTYIVVRPGQDDFTTAMKTAAMYAPAVVWVEDFDVVGSGGTDVQISQLLDTLDGITNKGVEVIAAFTTNHVEKLQKGVLRPGRLDAIIHIGALDQPGVTKLVKSLVNSQNLGDIDFQKVFEEFVGFYPAFVVEAIHSAVRHNLTRNNGRAGKIETVDLVNSAQGLRRQLELMDAAGEGANTPTLDSVLFDKFRETLNRVNLVSDTRGNKGLYVDPERELDESDVSSELA